MPEYEGPHIPSIALGVALGMTIFYGSCMVISRNILESRREQALPRSHAVRGVVVGETFRQSVFFRDSYVIAIENERGRKAFYYAEDVSAQPPSALSALFNPGDEVELSVGLDDGGREHGLDAMLLKPTKK